MARLRNGGIITNSDYVGKSLEEATQYAQEGGFTVRVVERDGVHYMVTMDLRSDRLNFRVMNNIVTDVYGG